MVQIRVWRVLSRPDGQQGLLKLAPRDGRIRVIACLHVQALANEIQLDEVSLSHVSHARQKLVDGILNGSNVRIALLRLLFSSIAQFVCFDGVN